jgi:hypothetical protein
MLSVTGRTGRSVLVAPAKGSAVDTSSKLTGRFLVTPGAVDQCQRPPMGKRGCVAMAVDARDGSVNRVPEARLHEVLRHRIPACGSFGCLPFVAGDAAGVLFRGKSRQGQEEKSNKGKKQRCWRLYHEF